MNQNIKKLFNTNPIIGEFCSLIHIEESDAEFICNLRNEKRDDNFLKKTPDNVDAQIDYIRNYKKRFNNFEEIYFKILDNKNNKACGLVRLTEILNNDIFNWQSLVVATNSSPNIAIDSMLMIYRIGFEFLNKKVCGPWEVDKNFIKMIKIHNFIKIAKMSDSNEKYFLFSVNIDDYKNNIERFKKMNYAKLTNLI